MIMPPDEFNTQLAKLLQGLKKHANATTVKQGYKGTGTRSYRRHIWISLGGVIRKGLPPIRYEEHTPAEVYAKVATALGAKCTKHEDCKESPHWQPPAP